MINPALAIPAFMQREVEPKGSAVLSRQTKRALTMPKYKKPRPLPIATKKALAALGYTVSQISRLTRPDADTIISLKAPSHLKEIER